MEVGVDQSGVTIHWVDSGVDTVESSNKSCATRIDTLDTFETRTETELQALSEVLDGWELYESQKEALELKDNFRLLADKNF